MTYYYYNLVDIFDRVTVGFLLVVLIPSHASNISAPQIAKNQQGILSQGNSNVF